MICPFCQAELEETDVACPRCAAIVPGAGRGAVRMHPAGIIVGSITLLLMGLVLSTCVVGHFTGEDSGPSPQMLAVQQQRALMAMQSPQPSPPLESMAPQSTTQQNQGATIQAPQPTRTPLAELPSVLQSQTSQSQMQFQSLLQGGTPNMILPSEQQSSANGAPVAGSMLPPGGQMGAGYQGQANGAPNFQSQQQQQQH